MGTFYVTTPIYYVNDVPHIGHAYTTVMADAVARWHRLMGDETMFVTGTDEHGLKVQRSAEANGVSPQTQADVTSKRFKEVWDHLNVAPDQFIRTTEPRHHKAVGELLTIAKDNGYIEKGSYAGHYCVGCEAYYSDSDLVDGNCPVHERPVEWFEEENYFFKLSAFDERLRDWYKSGAIRPEGKASEALGIVEQGLDDISITRTSIDWGVPVPWDDKHVFYVWYDALINYATAAGYGEDDGQFNKWWSHCNHLIGKDILRFHCVYWPAMLMAAGIDPPEHVNVHGFLLLGGKKLSKSGLTQIAPLDLTVDFGVDGLRYHLLRDIPFGPDSDFSYEGMVERYNSDLANALGNLLSRVITVVGKKCGGVAPGPSDSSPLASIAEDSFAKAEKAWDEFAVSIALDSVWHLIRETNAYLGDNEPWKMDEGTDEVKAVLGDCLEVLRIVAILASPALVDATKVIWRSIGLPGAPADERLPEAVKWGGYPAGASLTQPEPLFPRLRKDS